MRSVNRSRGQPPTFIEEARRAQIIACAIDTLAELGYAQASLARIGERAGISKGLISYHFATKDELLEQVVITVYRAGAAYVTPRIQAERTAPAMLAACLRSNLEFLRDHARDIAAARQVIGNLRAAGGELRFAGHTAGDEQILQAIQVILRKGQADGDFRQFDPATMAWVIRSAIDGAAQRAARDPGFDFGACIGELTALFERATAAGGLR
ncbi:MAG: TetR family transcriptional regulator [Actinobacteria bacterium]|nr:TetR family transcriptional regulator [Actinomycetota bacterium]